MFFIPIFMNRFLYFPSPAAIKIRQRFCNKNYEYQAQCSRRCPTVRGRHARILVATSTSERRTGFHPTQRHGSGPGSHPASIAMGETSSSSNGISTRKEDPGVPCSFGSKEKSKPNFKQRKQKAMVDSERHHITFLAFRGCLKSLCNSKVLYFSKNLDLGNLGF